MVETEGASICISVQEQSFSLCVVVCVRGTDAGVAGAPSPDR